MGPLRCSVYRNDDTAVSFKEVRQNMGIEYNCPSCGSSNVAGYFYGTQEMYDALLEQITKRIPIYGGNLMSPETPMCHCQDCGHDWRIPHKFPFSGEEPKKAKKLRCVVDDMISLTKGKIYEVQTIENGAYGIIDDEEEGVYLYNPACFEIADDDCVVGENELPEETGKN